MSAAIADICASCIYQICRYTRFSASCATETVRTIEECASHNGRADLLRERIDGFTGD
ncbi:mycothiol transferase [Nocardia gipuzkoensis]|uniref:mycothiol transferase n=1 Tax=Nocardia gipuzkoensis TaxID=2749991 RepID=UPI003EE14479